MAFVQRHGLRRIGRGRSLRRAALYLTLLCVSLGASAAPPATERFERALAAAGAGHPALGRFRLEPLLHQPQLPRSQRAFAYYLRGVFFYREGHYVSAGQDYQRALEFDPTLAPARSALAWLHLKGLGVSKAPARARKLYTLAARQGHQEAQFNAAVLREQGLGGPVDLAGALHDYLAAAERGHQEALLRAGELHAQGQAPATAQPRIEALLADAAEAGQGEAPYL
jgi:FOG: TPR repeat, SEL1 subfamily